MPTLYARPSWQLARQLSADLFVLLWMLLSWTAAGIAVASIKAVATPSAFAEQRLKELSQTLTDSAGKIGDVPLVGEPLSAPLNDISTDVSSLQSGATAQVEAIHQTATTIGWVVFLLPVVTVLLLWLPWRLRFVRSAGSVAKLQASPHAAELLAWRALAHAPLTKLQQISPDPLDALKTGDQETIHQLAEFEALRHGVRYPRSTTNTGD